ncbi:5-bromo-4-chloroindolyl phosphate hydrolysis family protein [Lacticaseibacillus kribbianus]|uniref:5-bromo-4-chloroindolyl phosphate hydrolysis family protein n=1 Tax=Lacticaseibacillus kribbianus TaxID=2926292 RepID=UPI001CD5A4AC
MRKKDKQIRWWRVGVWTLGGLAIGLFSTQVWLAVFVALVFGFARLIGELSRPRPAAPTVAPPLTDRMAAHYAESGLSESEIDLFRETMDQVAAQIRQFETIENRVPKLKSVALNHDLDNVMHAYFKAVVKTPKQLASAGHFVYEQLPNLVNIAQKYEEISHHEVKTQDTYDVLTTAANALGDLAEAIKTDYAAFVENDLDDLEASVALAKKQMQERPRLSESTTLPGHELDLSAVKEEMEKTHE